MNEELDDTYKAVFRQCYPKLLFYATRLVGTEEAEDVVQDVFVELWRRRDSVVIGEQILAFLYRSVYTKAINLLKHQVIENNYSAAMIEIYERKLQYYQPDHAEVIKKIENQELRQEIFGAINELPDKCKEVFKLSYLHDMKNKEIADTLGISLRTLLGKTDRIIYHLSDTIAMTGLASSSNWLIQWGIFSFLLSDCF